MAEPTTPAPSVGKAAFTFILIMVAFDFLAFGIIAPVLPDLIRQFEGGDFLVIVKLRKIRLTPRVCRVCSPYLVG